ncbi:MAG TPA: alpha/beta hydrolase [Gemmatimonadales bacterium]
MLAACAPAPDREPALPTRGVLTVNGMQYPYFIEGSGSPTCLVVGYPLAVSRALSSQLKERLRFVFLESRLTTSESVVGDVSAMTMDTLVDDIEQARVALGLERVCVLGHSIAGILAVEYARKYPRQVTHAIMHGTPPYWNQRAADSLAAFWEREASPGRKQQLEANWARVSQDSLGKLSPSQAVILTYITNAPKYFHDPTYDPGWILEGDYWNVEAMQRLLGPIMAEYDLATGPAIEPPVFLAIGRSDYIVPFLLWDTEGSKIPNLSYHLFDQSGHYPMLEEAARFDELLLAWIQGTSR